MYARALLMLKGTYAFALANFAIECNMVEVELFAVCSNSIVLTL